MKDGKCSKGYPKQWCDETRDNVDGYPEYRRRQNGCGFLGRNDFFIDNRWVVPHNRALTKRFGCHVNMEYCASIHSVKYLHKYIYKGPDRAGAKVSLDVRDEITEYLAGRYVSTSKHWGTPCVCLENVPLWH
jgi:hypothetical protein